MPGRKPKPTKLHALHGNPSKLRLGKGEPQPDPCVPEPPDHLGEEALREWNRVAPQLELLGVLTAIDRNALAAYCVAFARWADAERKLESFGVIVKSPNGYPMTSPYVTISNGAMKFMRDFACEFGMTPASRSRIVAAPKQAKSAFREYLDGA